MGNRTKGIFNRDITVRPRPKTPVAAPDAPVVAQPTENRTEGIFKRDPQTTTQTQTSTEPNQGFWAWMNKTYHPSVSQVGRAALDDVSFGFADPIRSKLTGENVDDLRKQSADAQAAMGPAGYVMNAATYALPGLGEGKAFVAAPAKILGAVTKRLAPYIGRYGAAGTEAAAVNAISTAGHEVANPNGPNFTGIDPYHVAWNSALGFPLGVGGQALGDTVAAGSRPVLDWMTRKGGRSSEQWPSDWRQRAATGDATLQPDIQAAQTLTPPGPTRDALGDLNTALRQSTAPGPGARALQAGALAGGSWAGFSHLNSLLEGFGGAGLGTLLADRVVGPLASGVNTIDRNINVGQAFDRLYPMYTGARPPTTDMSAWAPFIRQSVIGGDDQR
jgi:hypothetical protein